MTARNEAHHLGLLAELLLSWVLERLLEAALLAANEDSHIVFGCRSENSGVVIDVEYRASTDPTITWNTAVAASDLAAFEMAIAAIPATMKVVEVEGTRLLCLTLPVELRRTHAPPAPNET
jgi:hypothetical protein